MAERLVHIGDERRDLAAMRRADGDHLAGQLQRTVQVLHERAVAHRDIEQDRVRTGGQLLGHDGGCDQRDAADGGGHIAQGVHLLVGDGDFAALADEIKADMLKAIPAEAVKVSYRAQAVKEYIAAKIRKRIFNATGIKPVTFIHFYKRSRDGEADFVAADASVNCETAQILYDSDK